MHTRTKLSNAKSARTSSTMQLLMVVLESGVILLLQLMNFMADF